MVENGERGAALPYPILPDLGAFGGLFVGL